MVSVKRNRRIPVHIRFAIVNLRKKGISCKNIPKKLRNDYNFHIDTRGVRNYYSRYLTRHTVFDVKRSGRKKEVVPPEIDRFIFNRMCLDNETTAQELQGKIKKRFKKLISLLTIKRTRRAQGWRYANVKYAQFVRAKN